MKDNAVNVGRVATAVATPAVGLIGKAGKKVFDDNKSVIINNGAKIIENGINKVLKK